MCDVVQTLDASYKMDRWNNVDDDTQLRHGRGAPQGKVALHGLGGFVRSSGDAHTA
jgi:hypothetical protein